MTAATRDDEGAGSRTGAGRRRFSRRAVLRVSALGASAGLVGFAAGRVTAPGAEIPDWTAADIPAQNGRRVVVTGANGYPREGRSGLGYHQALELARAGADVTIASRNAERGDEAVRRIRAAAPGAGVRFEPLDLANLSSIGAFVARMRDSGDTLDLLINNAGVMGRLDREVSVDGFERVFATNALGPFALSAQLLPLLRNGSEPRIVWVASSRGHLGAINFDDLQKEREYDYGRAYNDAKLGDLLIAFECERRSTASGWRVTSIAAHPGVARTSLIPDGPGLDSSEGWRFRYLSMMFPDAAQGALPLLYAATSPQANGGGYYGPSGFLRGLPGVQNIPENARDPRLAAAYWDTMEQLSGVSFS